MTRPRERVAPLATLVGLAVLAACACTLVVAAVVLHADHRMSTLIWQIVVAGGPMAILIAGSAALFASRFARTLRMLRGDASTPIPRWNGSELVELSRTLEALQVRVRMADEVAERHRRSAETASAGMFELLAGLVEAEEGARGQLSAELHDTVAQSLMTARSLLADAGPEISFAAELVAEAEDQVRAVMARTRPPALREGDLARAVGALRDDLENRYGLRVDVGWPQQAYPLPLVTAVTVYRFFQEGLLNVIKHADVDEARADLRIDEQWVVACVSDNGPGFDPDAVHSE